VLLDLQRFGAQGVLHAALTLIDPLLNLGGVQVIRPTGIGHVVLPVVMSRIRAVFRLAVQRLKSSSIPVLIVVSFNVNT
jgi:hypothetical protein